jgi:hypothetical protein
MIYALTENREPIAIAGSRASNIDHRRRNSMKQLDSVARYGTVERELNENTFLALIKYARHIVRFHYRGVVAELEPAPSDSALDGEAAV